MTDAGTPRSLFVSHGAPNLLLHNSAARDFLSDYGRELGRPAAILVASAHWETDAPQVSAATQPETIHDFRGFERELHDMTYPAPGAPEVADAVKRRLDTAGIPASVHPTRGLDHGAWVPLALLYPDADVPVLQVSVQPAAGPRAHLRLGEALAPLADEGVLIVGSGSLTHNLHEFFENQYPIDAPALDWVEEFGAWMHDKAEAGDRDALVDYRAQAPHAERNHPTDEHLLPFFVALGAAGEGGRAKRVHTSHTYGILQMDAYAFG